MVRGWSSLSLVAMVDCRPKLDLKKVPELHHLPDSEMLPLNDYSMSDAKALQMAIQAVQGSKRTVSKALLVVLKLNPWVDPIEAA
jgi:hypothetical protein